MSFAWSCDNIERINMAERVSEAQRGGETHKLVRTAGGGH